MFGDLMIMLADTAQREKLHAHTARTLLARTRRENHHHNLSERTLGQIHLQMEKSDWEFGACQYSHSWRVASKSVPDPGTTSLGVQNLSNLKPAKFNSSWKCD